MLWDLRFESMVKLWRHSSGGPIHRLATCARLPASAFGGVKPEGGGPSAPQPLAFVASGENEVAVFDLSRGGSPSHCFRSLPPLGDEGDLGADGLARAAARERNAPLPTLDEVPLRGCRHRVALDTPLDGASPLSDAIAEMRRAELSTARAAGGARGGGGGVRDAFGLPSRPHQSVRAIMGRISNHGRRVVRAVVLPPALFSPSRVRDRGATNNHGSRHVVRVFLLLSRLPRWATPRSQRAAGCESQIQTHM